MAFVNCVTEMFRPFRVSNTSSTTSISVSVSINDVEQIASTVVPPSTTITLGTLNVVDWTNVILDYGISGYTPSSASLFIFPTTIGAPTSITSAMIEYANVDLTINSDIYTIPAGSPTANVDLTINP